MERIVLPTVRAMARDGRPFKGLLYAGLMLTELGPKLLEYNVRFGDPECQALLMRLSSDLLPALLAARDGVLKDVDLRWYDETALCVVMAAKGLPRRPAARQRDKRPRRRRERSRRENLSCRHQARRRPADRRWRPRARRHRARKRHRRRPRPRLRCDRPDRLAGRILPPRHRTARCGNDNGSGERGRGGGRSRGGEWGRGAGAT